VKKSLVHISNPPKKSTAGDKTKPLSFQRVGPQNEQLGVTWLTHLVVLSRNAEVLISMCAITSKRVG